MADYTIISDVSSHLVNVLRKNMCPAPITLENKIDISSPNDEEMDYILGVYLYDIKEEGQVTIPPLNIAGKTEIKQPPKPYALYYMVFVNGSSKTGLKASDLQKIIGKAAQIVNDNNWVLPSKLQSWIEIEEAPIVITQASITLEEKFRVWQAINKPYQVSLFYRVAPVFLSSGIVSNIPLVREANFDVQMNFNRRGGR